MKNILTTFIILLVTCSSTYGQITFTPAELNQLAKNNLERKRCQELNKVLRSEIDTLNLKVKILNQQVELKDTTISNLFSITESFSRIEKIRKNQTLEQSNRIKEDAITIKKQNRKLNFWRIFTPVTVTAIAIGSIFLK